MNYREKMRKAIECPQFGNINYGEWGALRLNQRKNIKRLLDEMDSADAVIKHQFFEIERLNNIIDELEKELNKGISMGICAWNKRSAKSLLSGAKYYQLFILDYLQELKGDNNEK